MFLSLTAVLAASLKIGGVLVNSNPRPGYKEQ